MDQNDILLNIFFQIDDLESIISLIQVNKQINRLLNENLRMIVQNIYIYKNIKYHVFLMKIFLIY